MNVTQRTEGQPHSVGLRSKAIALSVILLSIAYVQAGPWISKQFGVALPGITTPQDREDPEQRGDLTARGADRSGRNASSKSDDNRVGSTSPTTKSGGTAPQPRPEPREFPSEKNRPANGEYPSGLKSYGDVMVSRAGLRYTPGSYEGHRLKHILRHTSDQSDRNVHGVFDASKQEKLISIIDEAYGKARQGGRNVKQERDRRRTIYTVEMGRRIGYVGGQKGKRENYPLCTKVKLVLEEQDVITAYPVER